MLPLPPRKRRNRSTCLRAPLMRARLVRLAPDDHAFLLTTHHIISDNWSSNVLVREMAALYDAATRQVDAQGSKVAPEILARILPPLPIQYRGFCRVAAGMAAGRGAGRNRSTTGSSKLAGAPPAARAPHRPAATVCADLPRRVPVVLRCPGRLRRRCAALCQREGVTPFMALLAAFQTLLEPATRARTTSSSARPSPTATGASWKASSASSSTRSCCGRASPCRASIRPSASCCAGAGDDAGRVRAPGHAVRDDRGRAEPAAQSRPLARSSR